MDMILNRISRLIDLSLLGTRIIRIIVLFYNTYFSALNFIQIKRK